MKNIKAEILKASQALQSVKPPGQGLQQDFITAFNDLLKGFLGCLEFCECTGRIPQEIQGTASLRGDIHPSRMEHPMPHFRTLKDFKRTLEEQKNSLEEQKKSSLELKQNYFSG